MSGADARGRIHQSDAFQVAEVTGRTIDALWTASEHLHLRCNTVPYRQGFIEVFDGAHPGLINLETWEVQTDVVLSGVASVADLADDRAVRTHTELELTPAEARPLAAALLAAADAAER